MLGTYAIAVGTLRFTPLFPFDPGQRYDVVLDPLRLPTTNGVPPAPWRVRPLEASITVPAPEGHPTTRVAGVFPSADEVPENQLRLYISFSAPMGLASGSGHVRLLDQTGRPVNDPFLPLDVDLWNEDRTRYTVLFDPGRVKRGILPNEEMGRALIVGQKYTILVDETWRDEFAGRVHALGTSRHGDVRANRRDLAVADEHGAVLDDAACDRNHRPTGNRDRPVRCLRLRDGWGKTREPDGGRRRQKAAAKGGSVHGRAPS